MNYKSVENLLYGTEKTGIRKEWNDYMNLRRKVYEILSPAQTEAGMISEANWILRRRYQSSDEFGLEIRAGDICYIDFGQAYLNETGYQHFGLIVGVYRRKLLVIPMTSNEDQYRKAYDPVHNPKGKKHLMRLGKAGEMNRDSVLFLNDMKFLSSARVIDIKGHIPVRGNLFKEVRFRIKELFTEL